MSEVEVTTTGLLSAYLNGDVSATERAAVEKYLVTDASARVQLSELRALNVLLKAGDREARAEAAEKLRRTVLQIVQDRQVQAALISGIVGEQDESERIFAELQLKSNPSAHAELSDLRKFSHNLKNDGDRVASDELSAKLRMRLNAALPAAALAKSALAGEIAGAERAATAGYATTQGPPSSAAVQSGASARSSQRPSLRIFVKREDPWKKRVLIMGSMAALLAVFAGVGALRGPDTSTAKIPNPLDVPPPIGPTDNGHPKVPPPSHPELVEGALPPRNHNVPVPPNEVVRQMPPENKNAPEEASVAPEKINFPKVPVEVVKDRNVVAPENNAPRDSNKIVPPRTPVPQPNIANRENPTTPNNSVPDNQLPQNNVGVVALNPGANTNFTPSRNGGLPVVTPNNNQTVAANNPPTTPNSTTPPRPPNDVATVDPTAKPKNPKPGPLGVTSDDGTNKPVGNGTATIAKLSGAGLAQMTVSNKKQVLTKDMTVPSGATIETGDSLIALELSDGSHVYINGNSTVVLNIGKNNVITLQSGEVYYIGKNVSVTAGKVIVDQAIEADVSIAGVVRAGNLNDRKMKVTADGAKKMREDVPNGMQAVVPADASDVIKEEPVSSTPGNWRQPVLLDGDGLKFYTTPTTRARSIR